MTTTKAASYLTTYMKIDSRTPTIHQVVGLVSELLIDHHKNIKGSPAAIIFAALVARISWSTLGRVERGLSHPRRSSTLEGHCRNAIPTRAANPCTSVPTPNTPRTECLREDDDEGQKVSSVKEQSIFPSPFPLFLLPGRHSTQHPLRNLLISD